MRNGLRHRFRGFDISCFHISAVFISLRSTSRLVDKKDISEREAICRTTFGVVISRTLMVSVSLCQCDGVLSPLL